MFPDAVVHLVKRHDRVCGQIKLDAGAGVVDERGRGRDEDLEV
jgi:hypothetical protein